MRLIGNAAVAFVICFMSFSVTLAWLEVGHALGRLARAVL